MIQRIQSLYILAAIVALGTLFFVDLGQLSGEVGLFNVTHYGVVDVTKGGSDIITYLFPLASVLGVTVILALIDLFLFKNRMLQMRVATITAALSIASAIMIVLTNWVVASSLDMSWSFYWTMILPIAAAILMVLAYRKISDDEALIRSLNRLR
ncbi:MAG: DUF4293 domain-containing protein [Bacteroidales bacterium]|nr:DUF4293 domain-containing protein [Bacteroidales bacterium]